MTPDGYQPKAGQLIEGQGGQRTEDKGDKFFGSCMSRFRLVAHQT